MKTAIVSLSLEFRIGNIRQKTWRIPVTDEATADDVKQQINNVTPFGATVTIKSIEFEAIAKG